jgi:hypothetical protein
MDFVNNLLERNRYFYQYIKSKIDFTAADFESIQKNIALMNKLGRFAWRNHSGCFYDADIENLLISYGSNLEGLVNVERVKAFIKSYLNEKNNFTTLHLVTELAEVGGHTRVVNQIIKRAKEENQILVLTEAETSTIPNFIFHEADNLFSTCSLNSLETVFEKALALRLLSLNVKRVIAYTHPADVVPVLAFANNGGTPVVFENHSHSWFWYGRFVADMVLCHSEYHTEFTRNYRDNVNSFYLPFTQVGSVNHLPTVEEKLSAKKMFGIDSNHTVILTVATREKYIPNKDYNYFELADEMLKKYLELVIIVVGISPKDPLIQNVKKHERLMVYNYMTDLSNFYLAADLCLESMPQPSLGIQLQAPVVGLCCPFPKYGKSKVFKSHLLMQSTLYKNHFGGQFSKEEFFTKLDMFINNSELRIKTANEIRENYLNTRSDDLLFAKIEELYKIIDSITHTVQIQNETKFYIDEESIEIAERSELQDLSEVINYWKDEFPKPIDSKLYYDLGDGFNESNSFVKHLDINSSSENNEVEIKFDLKNVEKNIINLRFDPIENSTCIVEIKEVELTCDGDKKYLSVADSNAALNYNNKLIFTSDDPSILFILPQDANNVESIIIRLKYLSENQYLPLIGEIISENSSQQNEAKKEYISKLYYDNGKGYSEENSVVSILPDLSANNMIELDIDLKDAGNINALRYDPIENESAVVEIESCTAYYQNNSFPLNIVKANADFHSKGCFVFSTTDPNLHLSLPKGAQKIDFLNVKYRLLVRNNKQ